MKLSEVKVGQVFKIGEVEFIKFSDVEGVTEAVTKDLIFKSEFGRNNNFAESKILGKLKDEFLPKISAAIGIENICDINTDLTSLDGLKTYGSMTSKISIPTFDFYRNNVEIFDKYKVDGWWWLATPDTTPEHYNDWWVRCVSPVGNINYGGYCINDGVRPFLRFVSSISVSCEE